jgi:hypothetical protein
LSLDTPADSPSVLRSSSWLKPGRGLETADFAGKNESALSRLPVFHHHHRVYAFERIQNLVIQLTSGIFPSPHFSRILPNNVTPSKIKHEADRFRPDPLPLQEALVNIIQIKIAYY